MVDVIVQAPRYQILDAKSGAPVLAQGEPAKPLASRFDPQREAARLVDSAGDLDGTPCVVAGVAGAAIAMELLERGASPVVIVEKDTQARDVARRVPAWAQLFDHPAVSWICPASSATLTSALQESPTATPRVFALRSLIDYGDADWKALLEAMHAFRASREVNGRTLQTFEAAWTQNFFGNLPALVRSPDLQTELRGLQGHPWLIVAPGPSLGDQLDDIALAQNGAVLVAVNAALPILGQAGIVPDFGMLVDPQPALRWMLTHLPRHLIVEATVHPSTVRAAADRTRFVAADFPALDVVSPFLTHRPPHLPSGGSVATSALSLALKSKAKAIAFAGFDLAYAKDLYHTAGAPTDLARVLHASRLNPALTTDKRLYRRQGMLRRPGWNGKDVWTDQKMVGYLRWMEQAIAKNGVPVADTTPRGLAKAGMSHVSLREWLAPFQSRGSTRSDSASPRLVERVEPLMKHLQGLANQFAALEELAHHVVDTGSVGQAAKLDARLKALSPELNRLLSLSMQGLLGDPQQLQHTPPDVFYQAVARSLTSNRRCIRKAAEQLAR